MSWKNARQLSVSSLVPGLSARRTFLPSWSMPHAQRTASRARPVTEPLGDAVDEQVEELMLREVPGRERLVLLPESLGHFAHGRPREERPAVLIGERRLDVAGREPAGVHLDGQPFQLLGAPGESFTDPGPVWLPQVRHLRRRVLDRSLGALQPPPPIAVSIPGALPVAAVVIRPTEPVLHLGLEHFLDELAHAEAYQVGADVVVSASRQQLLDPRGRLPRCWNPSASHGSTSSSDFQHS